jgi:hypothetical protein
MIIKYLCSRRASNSACVSGGETAGYATNGEGNI